MGWNIQGAKSTTWALCMDDKRCGQGWKSNRTNRYGNGCAIAFYLLKNNFEAAKMQPLFIKNLPQKPILELRNTPKLNGNIVAACLPIGLLRMH